MEAAQSFSLFLCNLGKDCGARTDVQEGRAADRRGAGNLRGCGQGRPGGPVVKNPPASAGHSGFDPWSGKIPHASGQLSFQAATTKARVP